MVATPTWSVIGAFFNSVQSAPVGNRPKEEEVNEQEDEDDEMADDRVPLYFLLLPFILISNSRLVTLELTELLRCCTMIY